jgi:hypothetical protein
MLAVERVPLHQKFERLATVIKILDFEDYHLPNPDDLIACLVFDNSEIISAAVALIDLSALLAVLRFAGCATATRRIEIVVRATQDGVSDDFYLGHRFLQQSVNEPYFLANQVRAVNMGRVRSIKQTCHHQVAKYAVQSVRVG